MNDAACSSILYHLATMVGNNSRASEYTIYKNFYDAQCSLSEVCAKLQTNKSFTTEKTNISEAAQDQASITTPDDNKRQQHQWACEVLVLCSLTEQEKIIPVGVAMGRRLMGKEMPQKGGKARHGSNSSVLQQTLG